MMVLGIYLLFFISGVSGLIYEVVWLRGLSLCLGSDFIAIQGVLASYFLGLGLGAKVLGRRIDSCVYPVRVFAILEFLVAVGGIISFFLIRKVFPFFVPFILGKEPLVLWRIIVGFIISLVAILPATFPMGATLPALCSGFIQRISQRGPVLGKLYSVNTLGGVIGILISAFLFLRVIGLRNSFFVAILGNIFSGCCAWVLGVREVFLRPRVEEKVVEVPKGSVLGIVLFLCGLISIGVELVGIRILRTIFQNTIYSFSITIAIFLIGIALGGMVYGLLLVRRFKLRVLLVYLLSILGVGLLVWGLVLLFAGRVYDFLLKPYGSYPFIKVFIAELIVGVLVLLGPAFLFGVIFCVLASLRVEVLGRASSRVGEALFLNSLGCVVSPLIAGFLVLYLGGTYGLLVFLSILGFFSAYLALFMGVFSLYKVPVFATLFGLIVAVVGPRDMVFWRVPGEHQVIMKKEGLDALVSIEEDSSGHRRLMVNNRYGMGGGPGVFGERRLGHLPLLIHSDPKRVLVLGIGTGNTLGAVSLHKVKVEAVEILPEVILSLSKFAATNFNVHLNRRVRYYSVDARSFVISSLGRDRYDIVIADLYHPQRAGIGSLYTLEHFSSISRLLKPDGFFVQWLPLYELSPNELKIIIRTFCRVFPEVISFLAYFNVETSVLGLFGAHLPFKLDLERLETKINQKRLFSILKKVMYDDPLEIMGSYITNSKGLKAFVGRGPINTDDHPLVEFGLPLRYLKERQGIYYESLQEVLKVRKVIGPNELKFSASWPLKDTLERLKRRKVAIDAFMQGQLEERFQEIDKAIKYYQYGYNVEPEYRLNYKVLYNLAVKRLYVGDIETAIEIVSWLMAREDNIELYHLNQRLRGLY